MDYKEMWEKLKKEVISLKAYHSSGELQSMGEAIQGEACCEEILKIMSQIEAEAHKGKSA
jgi:hypothetical protein